MWLGLSQPAPADRRQRWIVPSQPAVRADPLEPLIASPASPRLGASVRVPGGAAGIQLKGSRPASTPLLGARADWSHSAGPSAALLCGLGVPGGASGPH